MAHEIPYVATATVADLRDLEAKVERAMALRGARYLHVLVHLPARLGHGVAATRSGSRGSPCETGLFPVFEAEHGEVTDVTPIRRRVPVEDYLRPQTPLRAPVRARAPRRRDRPHPGARRPQHRPLSGCSRRSRDGQAVRHHARRRLEPRQQDRRLAHRAPRLRAPPAAVQRTPARPARTSSRLALPRRGGRLRARLAADHGRQPVARRHGPGLLPPVRDGLQPRRSSTRRSASTRSSASSATRRSGRAGRVAVAAPATGQARPRRRRRARPACPPPTTCAGSATTSTIRDAGAAAGRHDALRHPALPAAARRARRRDRSGSSTWASSSSSTARSTTSQRRDARRAASTPRSSPSARTSASAPTSRPATAARILDAVSLLRDVEDGEPPQLGRRVVVYGGGNTAMDAARTARRLGADGGDRRLPAHPRPDARPRLRGRGGARGGRARASGCPPSSTPTPAGSSIERMELDDSGFPQPTGELEELEADSLVLALGQEADLSLLDGVAGHRGRRRRRAGRTEHMMTGRPGVFAGGDMVPAERTVDRRRSGTASRPRRSIDAWLRGDAYRQPRPSPTLVGVRRAQHLVLRRRAAHRAARGSRPPAAVHVRRGRRRARRVDRAVRGAPLPVLRQLLRVRQLLRRLPRQRRHQARRPGRTRTRSTSTTARAAGSASQECPAGAIEMEPEQI